MLPDKTVCSDCVDELYLSGYVRQNATENQCSYCGRASDRPVAISLEELAEVVSEAVDREYEDAANSVPYESAEGGYQLPTLDSQEVLEEMGLFSPSDALLDDLAASLPGVPWVKHSPMSLSRLEALGYGWDEFCRLVKHHTRYLFFERTDLDEYRDYVHPAEMLVELGELVLEHNLVSQMDAGTVLYRVRQHMPNETPSTLVDLGPPPTDRVVSANRMSPAGVSMMYVSLDPITAAWETLQRRSRTLTVVTTAEFQLTSPIRVLDLTRLPDTPSPFDPASDGRTRHGIAFIHSFTHDLTQPVQMNRSEHIEYVPSQVVTEFFRHRFRTPDDRAIHGILYTSAVRKRGRNCVLFFSHEDCQSSPIVGIRRSLPFVLKAYDARPLRGHP